MNLISKLALSGILGIGVVGAVAQWKWRTAERPWPVLGSAAPTTPIGPTPAIAAVPETPKPVAEPAAQPAPEKQVAAAKPAQKKRKKRRRRRA
jgi:hypothetical protein